MFALPFIIFMLLMVVLPLTLVFIHAFRDDGGFTFNNFRSIFTDGFSMRVLGRSLWMAVIATVIILLVAYPIAYGLAMAGFKRKTTILLLFTLPMWTNLLLRSNALRAVFYLVDFPLGFWAIMVAFLLNFLPIMILPIYVVLSNIDKKYIEASQDLGASLMRVFFKTVLPLSAPGIVAGVILVFSPIVSTYFISGFFGGGGTGWRMFGELLNSFIRTTDYGEGAVLSIILLLIVGTTVFILNRFSKVGNKRGGLW